MAFGEWSKPRRNNGKKTLGAFFSNQRKWTKEALPVTFKLNNVARLSNIVETEMSVKNGTSCYTSIAWLVVIRIVLVFLNKKIITIYLIKWEITNINALVSIRYFSGQLLRFQLKYTSVFLFLIFDAIFRFGNGSTAYACVWNTF